MFNKTSALTALLFFLLGARAVAAVTSDAGIGWDFSNYFRAAREIFQGHEENFFRVDPLYAYFGFPGTIYLIAPIGGLNERDALFAFKSLCAACLTGALWLFYPLFRYATRESLTASRALQAYVLVILLYAPLWFIFTAGGQMSAPCLLLLVVFLRLYMSGRLSPAALPLALCILIKPFFAPVAIVFLMAREWQLLFRLGVWISAMAILSLGLLGWEAHVQWLHVIQLGAKGYIEPWWNNSSLWNLFDTIWLVVSTGDTKVNGLLLNPWGQFAAAGRLLTIPLFYLAIARGDLRTMRQSARRLVLTFMAILFCLLQSAIVWPHYLVFLLPFLLIVTFTSQPLPRAARVAAWLAFVSTLAVQSRPLQEWVLHLLPAAPIIQGAAAGLFGACTLLLCSIILVFWHGEIIVALAKSAPAMSSSTSGKSAVVSA